MKNPLVPWVAIGICGIVLMLSLSFIGLGASKEGGETEGDGAQEVVIDDPVAAGEEIYKKTCMGCHGETYDQIPNAQLNVFTPDDKDHIIEVVTNGKGMGMPAFGGQLQKAEIEAIAEFLTSLSQ